MQGTALSQDWNVLATTSIEIDSDKWDAHVKQIQSALNTAFNKSINTTPVQALFGYQARPMAEANLLNSKQVTVDRINIADLRRNTLTMTSAS